MARKRRPAAPQVPLHPYVKFTNSFGESNKARARIILEQTASPDLLMESRDAMQDVTMLLFTVIFFGLAFLYVKACQKLR
jgi:hypothetical protein